METIRQRDLRNDSGKILAAVEAGKSFVVTRHGKPIAKLEPLTERTFVPIAELNRTHARVPKIDYARWRADMAALIDQDIPDFE